MTRRPPEWPVDGHHEPTHPPTDPAEPVDLSEASSHYAKEARAAARRAGGFAWGDPVRRRK